LADRLALLFALALASLPERLPYGADGLVEILAQARRIDLAAVQPRQRRRRQQCLCEGFDGLAGALARLENRVSPDLDPADGAGAKQPRQHPGADERRLAASAHAEHENEWARRCCLSLQALEYVVDRRSAAEEDCLVLQVEDLETAKRRLLPGGIPWRVV
jgi:hypothetical protein